MELRKFKVELLGIFTFLCAFGALCALSMSRFYSVFEPAAIVLGVVFLAAFAGLYHLELRESGIGHLEQINPLTAGCIIAAFLALIGAQNTRWYIKVLLLVWMILAGFSLFRYYTGIGAHKSKAKVNILEFVFKYRYLFVIIAVILLSGMHMAYLEPRWDSGIVFRRMNAKTMDSLFYFQDLTISGHLNIAYVVGNVLSGMVFGSTRNGMLIGNICVLIVGTIAFYRLLKMIVPDKAEWMYALVTCIFSFSPFFMGMMHVLCWDYWMICLFPLVILTAYQRKWILHFGAALLFSFLKEPAIIVYGFFCIGILICDLWARRGNNIKDTCIAIILTPYYWLMCIVGVCWVFLYITMTHWSGGGFTLDPHYISDKLSVLYILNFNWVFAILAIVSVVRFGRKDSGHWKWMLPILTGDLAFVVFSCLFQTSNHARYIDSHASVLYLFAGVLLVDLSKAIVQSGMSVVLAGLMLISSYFTIDPLSLKVFPTLDTGGGRIIQTSIGESISDATIYNRQYEGFEAAMSLALEDIVGETQIIFPLELHNVWYFDGISDFKNEEYFDKTHEFWNVSKKVRRNFEEKDTTAFDVWHISDQADLGDYLASGSKYAYIFLPGIGDKQAADIRENCTVLEEQTFKSGIFVLDRIIFEADR